MVSSALPSSIPILVLVMGNTIGTQRLDDLRYYLLDSPDIVVHSLLATYKLFKVFHCAHEGYKHGGVIVKLFIPNVPEEDELHEGSIRVESILKPYRDATFLLQCRLWGLVHPNVIPYESAEMLGHSAILMRQYLGRNLFDRLYSQPRLSSAHKTWFAFQLLCAVAQLHSVGAIHGDIKSENVFVNGSFHAVLTDLATFIKPVYLPLDDPVAATSLFFDSGGKRHRCFIAPERFIDSLTSRVLDEHGRRMTFFDKEFTREFVRMDIFSAGLTIAELFLEGQHVVDLPELLAFRSGSFDLEAVIDKIDNTTVRSLVKEMVQKSAKNRPFSAVSCLSVLQRDFSSLLLPLVTLSGHPVYVNADMRMMLVRANWEHIFATISGNQNAAKITQFDPFTELEIFEHSIHSSLLTRGVTASIAPLVAWAAKIEAGDPALFPHPILSRENCENFSKSLFQLWETGAEAHINGSGDSCRKSFPESITEVYNHLFVGGESTPLTEAIPVNSAQVSELLVSLLGSTVTACAWTRSKLVYLDIVRALSTASLVKESVVTEYVLPYVHELLVSAGSEPAVKDLAVDVVISLVSSLQKAETGLFSEYLFPVCFSVDSVTVVKLATHLTAAAVRLSQPDEGLKKLAAIRNFCDRFISFVLAKKSDDWTTALLENVTMFNVFGDTKQLIEFLSAHAAEIAGNEITRPALLPAISHIMTLTTCVRMKQLLVNAISPFLFTDDPGLVIKGIQAVGQIVGGSATLSSTEKAFTASAVSVILPFLFHPICAVRRTAERVLVRGVNFSSVDQFVFLRAALPKGCRTLIDLASARRPWPGLADDLWHKAVSGEPMDVTTVSASDREVIAYVKSLIAERHGRSSSMTLLASAVSNAMLSPPPPSHMLQVKPVNASAASPRPPVPTTAARVMTLSLSQFRDWRVSSADLPGPLPDLGCLSSIDGSFLSLYDSAPTAPPTTLQRRHLNSLPCVPEAAAATSPPPTWKPESLLLATLNEFSAGGLAVPVVAVGASDDGRIIVGAGADCTIRMWRTNSLETESVVQAARVVRPQNCSRLYTLKTLRNTKSFAVGTDSRMMLFRMDGADAPVVQSDTWKFGHVVAMDAFDTDLTSSVIFASESGTLGNWDIRSNRLAWTHKLDPSKSLSPSAIVTAKDVKSFAVSTLAGNVFVFDNRYMRVCKSFSLSTGPISAMAPSNTIGSVWISAGNDIGLYSMENGGEASQLLTVNAGGALPALRPVMREGISDTCMLDGSLSKLTRSDANSRALIECSGSQSTQWTLLSGHNDGVVRHWSSEPGQSGVAFPIQLEPQPVVEADRVIAQCSVAESGVEKLDSIAGKPCTITEGHRDVITDMCVASLQYDIVVTTGRDGLIKLWK